MFGQLPVALLLAMFAIFTELPTLSAFGDCTPGVPLPLDTEPLLRLHFLPAVPGGFFGAVAGHLVPMGSANRRLVGAVPEVSGGKMKTNGGAATSGTACGGASGGEGRGFRVAAAGAGVCGGGGC